MRILASRDAKNVWKNDKYVLQAEYTLSTAATIIDALLASGWYRDTRFIRPNLAELRKAGSKSLKLDHDGEQRTCVGESEDFSTNSVQSHSTSSDRGTDMEVTASDEEEPPLERGETVLRFGQEKKGLKGLTGLSYYHCKGEGIAKPRKNRQRVRKSQKLNCKAHLTIRFSAGYRPLPDGSLNVRDHGNDSVVITWNSEHNHDVPPLSNAATKKKVRAVLRRAVARGLSWRGFLAQRTEAILKSQKNGEPLPVHLCEIKYLQWVYESRRALTSLAYKDAVPETSLRIWAEEIKLLGGMAVFTDQFDFGKLGSDDTIPKSSRGSKIWSFCFMAEWQKGLLQNNSLIVFLDSTHKTCRGLSKDEEVYLFTLYVKNSVTGKGAPAAFMMTNCARSEVISHFLRKVREFAWFLPKQVVIDCDQAETNALREIWNDEVTIVYCRWHVLKAFANNVRTKVTLGQRGTKNKKDWDEHKALIKEKQKEMRAAFDEVVRSETKEIGEQRIQEFLSRFEDFPQLIEYTSRQWFAKKDFIINGRAKNFLIHASTNNFIESFHNVLKRYYLKRSSRSRPDMLVFKLFHNVVENYQAEDLMSRNGYAERANDKGEKAAKAKALKISKSERERLVTLVTEGRFQVKSFTTEGVLYLVELDDLNFHNAKCTCPAFKNSLSLCKHIFLGSLWRLESLHTEPEISVEQLIDTCVPCDGVEDDEDVDVAFMDSNEEANFRASSNVGEDEDNTAFNNADEASSSLRPQIHGDVVEENSSLELIPQLETFTVAAPASLPKSNEHSGEDRAPPMSTFSYETFFRNRASDFCESVAAIASQEKDISIEQTGLNMHEFAARLAGGGNGEEIATGTVRENELMQKAKLHEEMRRKMRKVESAVSSLLQWYERRSPESYEKFDKAFWDFHRRTIDSIRNTKQRR